MKSLRYIYWFFCLACAAVLCAGLIWMVSFTVYLFYTEIGFWSVVGPVAVIVVIVFGTHPIAYWNYRPWKKEDRQP